MYFNMIGLLVLYILQINMLLQYKNIAVIKCNEKVHKGSGSLIKMYEKSVEENNLFFRLILNIDGIF